MDTEIIKSCFESIIRVKNLNGTETNNFSAKCRFCSKAIRGNVKSSTNFLLHIKTKHSSENLKYLRSKEYGRGLKRKQVHGKWYMEKLNPGGTRRRSSNLGSSSEPKKIRIVQPTLQCERQSDTTSKPKTGTQPTEQNKNLKVELVEMPEIDNGREDDYVLQNLDTQEVTNDLVHAGNSEYEHEEGYILHDLDTPQVDKERAATSNARSRQDSRNKPRRGTPSPNLDPTNTKQPERVEKVNVTNENKADSEPTEDEFDMFGRIVTRQLRLLPLRSALKMQAQIQALLTNERISCLIEQEPQTFPLPERPSHTSPQGSHTSPMPQGSHPSTSQESQPFSTSQGSQTFSSQGPQNYPMLQGPQSVQESSRPHFFGDTMRNTNILTEQEPLTIPVPQGVRNFLIPQSLHNLSMQQGPPVFPVPLRQPTFFMPQRPPTYPMPPEPRDLAHAVHAGTPRNPDARSYFLHSSAISNTTSRVSPSGTRLSHSAANVSHSSTRANNVSSNIPAPTSSSHAIHQQHSSPASYNTPPPIPVAIFRHSDKF